MGTLYVVFFVNSNFPTLLKILYPNIIRGLGQYWKGFDALEILKIVSCL